MDNLGIEFISVFGMPPVAFVELAAELGCRYISLGTLQTDFDPHGYPRYDIKREPALRRELKAALAANNVTISLGENLLIQPGVDMRESWLANLEIFAELGVKRINSVTFEPDLQRNIEQYGRLAEATAGFGIEALLEFVPIFGVANLTTALTVAREVAHPNLRLLIDTMHVGRSGASAADLRALPTELIAYIQLCDAPLVPEIADYMYEAMFERRVPGEGDLPLASYLEALPDNLVIGLEIPLRTEAERGVGPRERVGRTVAAARGLLGSITPNR